MFNMRQLSKLFSAVLMLWASAAPAQNLDAIGRDRWVTGDLALDSESRMAFSKIPNGVA
jgi:hypothetical protein